MRRRTSGPLNSSKNYQEHQYDFFKGDITQVDSHKYKFGCSIFIVNTLTLELRAIFFKRLFYPKLIHKEVPIKLRPIKNIVNHVIVKSNYPLDSITLTAFEELKFLSNSPKQKRFRFWLMKRTILIIKYILLN